MKLLVVSYEPKRHAGAIEVAVGRAYSVLGFETLDSAVRACAPGATAGFIICVPSCGAHTVAAVARARAMSYQPVIVCRESEQQDWEEKAILAGAAQIFSIPPRAKLLLGLLSQHPRGRADSMPLLPQQSAAPFPTNAGSSAGILGHLREFSRLLREARQEDGLIRAYMEKLHETLRVNRLTLFTRARQHGDQQLSCAFAIGLEPELYRQVALSLSSGLGAWIREHMVAVSTHGDAAVTAPSAALVEMQTLRAHWALPFHDGERLIGVCLLGSKYTGQSLSGAEVEDVILLLGELARAISYARLTHEVSEERSFLGKLCDQMGAGLLVVDGTQSVRHANRQILALCGVNGGHLRFRDIPHEIGSMLFRASRESVPEISYRGADNRVYRLAFSKLAGASSSEVMLLAQDVSTLHGQHERELILREHALLTRMGEQFVHEVRNGLARLAGMAQLMPERRSDAEFIDELQSALPKDLGRILRQADQMFLLVQPSNTEVGRIAVAGAIQTAWREASKVTGIEHCGFYVDGEIDESYVQANEVGLRHALKEIFINAQQACIEKGAPKTVSVFGKHDGEIVHVEVHDSGRGFDPEIIVAAFEPFTTTKNQGFGLGLSVAKKLIRESGGTLELSSSAKLPGACVRISLKST